jgi:hypothetical protein
MNGDPVEINPSVGHGMKIMTVDEWSSRWKVGIRNHFGLPNSKTCRLFLTVIKRIKEVRSILKRSNTTREYEYEKDEYEYEI